MTRVLMDGVSPLTEQDYERIRDAMADIAEAQRQLDLAKRAGIDVSALEAQLTEQAGKLRALRQVYFPGR